MKNPSAEKVAKAWLKYTQRHSQLKLKLKLDKNISYRILKNKQIFTEVKLNKDIRREGYVFMSLRVCGKKEILRNGGRSNGFDSYGNYCFGSKNNEGTFAGKAKDFKYLSEFLAHYVSFIAKKGTK